MSKIALDPINLLQSAGAPSGTFNTGDTYYDTTAKAIFVYNGTTWTQDANLAIANTFTNTQQINTGADTNKGLIVRSNSATQSANLLELQASGGAANLTVNNNGAVNINIGNGTTLGTNNVGVVEIKRTLYVDTGATTSVGEIIRNRAGQTADLIQFQSSTPTTLSGVNAAGQIYAGTTAAVVGSTTTALSSAAYTSATVAVFTYGGTSLIAAGQTVTVAGVTGGTYNGTWVVSAATTTTFTVLGSGFTNTAGSGGTVKISANISVVASSTAQIPVVVQATGTQIIQEWQNSAGTSVGYVNSSGNIYGSNNFLVGGVVQSTLSNGSQLKPNSNGNNTLNSGSIQITGQYSNQLPLLVKQAALSTGTITAATANGTTVTYTTTASSTFVVGQTVTITGVVSTGNSGGTAGAGFNLTGATIATASTSQFTVTNALSDTYTSGGTATIAAQTADLTQWQNSSGTSLFSIGFDGRVVSSAPIRTTGVVGVGVTSSTLGQLSVITDGTTRVGAVIRGFTSQTADLQQWQTSAGTVMMAVGANGTFAQGTTAGAPTIASATTIAPVNPIVFVSGTTAIATITAPAPISTYGGSIKIIPTGAFTTTTAGNIALASTAVANKMLEMTYDPVTTKWYPSY